LPSYLPTLRQFLDKAQSSPYNCQLKTLEVTTQGGQESWLYLQRGELIAVLPNMEEHEILTGTILRSMIAQLNLPPLDFWMVL
jgi:hypothetical protein